MTLHRPWDPGQDRPVVPFSRLPEVDQRAMKARLAFALDELRRAVPENERLRRQASPTAPVPREETVA